MFGVQRRVVASDHAAGDASAASGPSCSPLAPLVLVLVTAGAEGSPTRRARRGRPTSSACFGLSVVLPLTALIIGTSVLGAEIDDGSIVHLLATPVRRSAVIVTKFAVAVRAHHGLRGGARARRRPDRHRAAPTSSRSALFVGALAGSVIYNAVFVMISVLTTRAIAVGLLYVLIWEGVLGNLVGGARLLSVGQYSLGDRQLDRARPQPERGARACQRPS